MPQIASLLVFLVLCAITTSTALKVKGSKCYIADSITNEDSDKYLLSKEAGQRYRLAFGFPLSRAYQTEWMVFVMRYKGKAVLQFAHKNNGNCQFLTQQPKAKTLSLTEPRKCRTHFIDTRTLFTTNTGPIQRRRYISFFLSPEKVLGSMRRNLILTSKSNAHHMSFWKINLNDQKICAV